MDASAADDEPVELGRYGRALKRNWVFMALIVLPLTALVLVFSLLIHKSYRASAQIVLTDNGGAFPSSDVETRQLATFQVLVTTRSVLAKAASELRGETLTSLERNVSASVDADANILSISATNRVPAAAATTANAVARAFLSHQRTATESQLAVDRANLARMLQQLRSTPANGAEARAIQERLSELRLEEASAGSNLQFAQPAIPPTKPYSPRPVRNALFAFFAAAFLAVLAALARENLVRRPAGPRELGRLLQLPILATLPTPRGGRGRRLRRARGAELEAYDALTASLEFQLGTAPHETLLVASAVRGEGSAEVAARLAETLADRGCSVLLVDADLRRPRLHQFFDVPPAPGFLDLLDGAVAPSRGKNGSGPLAGAIDAAVPEARIGERFALLPAGDPTSRRSRPFGRDGAQVAAVLHELSQRDHDYVLVAGPPLLGTVDGSMLARAVDSVLIAARVDQLTVDNVHDLRDLLVRSEINALGIAAVGVQGGPMPYYLGKPVRTAELDELPTA